MNLAGKYLNFGVDASIPNLGSFVPSGTEKTFYGNSSFTQDGGPTNSLTAQLPPKQNPFELKKRSTVDDALSQLILAKLDPAYQQRELENTLAFQKAQMREALPYKFISDASAALQKIPERISTDAANRAMLNVLGARATTDAFNQTMANYPRSNFQSSVPLVQRNYFT
jgi:hypothetical protein